MLVPAYKIARNVYELQADINCMSFCSHNLPDNIYVPKVDANIQEMIANPQNAAFKNGLEAVQRRFREIKDVRYIERIDFQLDCIGLQTRVQSVFASVLLVNKGGGGGSLSLSIAFGVALDNLNVETVKSIMVKHRINVNCPDLDLSELPFHDAIRYGKPSMIKLFLRAGADVGKVRNLYKDVTSALKVAADRIQDCYDSNQIYPVRSVLQMLFEADADPNGTPDVTKRLICMPLETMQYCIDSGVDVNRTFDRNGQLMTALDLAVSLESTDKIKLLAYNGALHTRVRGIFPDFETKLQVARDAEAIYRRVIEIRVLPKVFSYLAQACPTIPKDLLRIIVSYCDPKGMMVPSEVAQLCTEEEQKGEEAVYHGKRKK